MKNKVKTLLLLLLAYTGATAQVTILQQNFEQGTLPPGWTRTQNTPSAGFEFGDNLASSYFSIPPHTKYAASNDDKHDDNTTNANKADQDRLITPTLNLSSYNGVAITFSYYTTAAYGSTAHLEISTNNGASFNNLLDLAAGPTWQTVTINLSSYLQNNIKLAFRHNDHNNWAEGLAVDDVRIYSLLSVNGESSAVLLPEYDVATVTSIKSVITNRGTSPITSLKLEYKLNGQTPVVQTFQSLNITSGNSDTLTFTTGADLSTPGQYDICVAIKETNGNAELEKSNDTICTTINTLSSLPVKKVLLEEATGAWSQFAPDGFVNAANIASNYANAIVVTHHNSDAMVNEYSTIFNNEFISAYPAGTIDRYDFDGNYTIERNRGEWETKVLERLQAITPVAVSVKSQTWDSVTRIFTAVVEADFKGNVTGDIRMNLMVVEDSVTGTGTGFDQVNYYNTVSGHPFYGAGNPIVGHVHRNVVRTMLGGTWGTSGILPASIPYNTQYTYTYSDTLPIDQNENRIKLVALVQQYDQNKSKRDILNSEVVALDLTPEAPSVIKKQPSETVTTRIYPNPFSTQLNIEFNLTRSANTQITVTDLSGRVVAQPAAGYYNNGAHSVEWNAGNTAPGLYFVNIETEYSRLTQRVILK